MDFIKIFILLSSLLLTSCAVTLFPVFPEKIKLHYVVEVRDEEVSPIIQSAVINPEDIQPMQLKEVVRCLKFDIVSYHPYKIKFQKQVLLKECNMIGGLKPDDNVSLLNWIDDVYIWAETRKKCFK